MPPRKQIQKAQGELKRISVSYPYAQSVWAQLRKREAYYQKNYIHMFIEDVKASLYQWRKDDAKILELSPADAVLEKEIASALCPREHKLKIALWDFMDKGLLYTLLTRGKAYYEIAYYHDGTFQFIPIDDYTFVRYWGGLIQYVPPHLREEMHLPKFIKIKACNVFCLSLSSRLKKQMQPLISGLAYASENLLMPKFAKLYMEKETGMYPMDYAAYRKSAVDYLARLTKSTGWDARGAYKDQLEFYQLTRFLRFERYKAELRECIIDGLNKALRKVQRNWTPPQLIETGCPTFPDIDQSLQKLKTGTSTFHEIIEPYLPAI